MRTAKIRKGYSDEKFNYEKPKCCRPGIKATLHPVLTPKPSWNMSDRFPSPQTD